MADVSVFDSSRPRTREKSPRASSAARRLAALGLLLPSLALGGIFGCLWISNAYGTLENVFPPFDGAASVSRASREPPAIYLFRATVVPAAVVGALWWRAAAPFAGGSRRAVLLLGLAGAAGFFVYAFALGAPGARLVRRIAIYIFLSLTICAQLVFARAIAGAGRHSSSRMFLGATFALPFVCLSFLPAGAAILDDWDRAENFAEWHALWLMLLWFPFASRVAAASRR